MKAKVRLLFVVVIALATCSGLAQAQEQEADRIRAGLRTVASDLKQNATPAAVVSHLPLLSDALRNEELTLEALPPIERCIEILATEPAPNERGAELARLLKSAARLRYEQARPDLAGAHLEALRGLYRSATAQVRGYAEAQQKNQMMNEVALEYLRGDQTQAALEVLGESVDFKLSFPMSVVHDDAAVAGALHRRLDQVSTEQRYELLHAWTMPTEQRRTVRVLTSLASVEAPPDVFARALGERPRANSFPVPQIGGVDGLFSTAWSLVRAAAQTGRLRRLTTELDELVRDKVPNAEYMQMLARLADASQPVEDLKQMCLSAVPLPPSRNQNGPADPRGLGKGLLQPAEQLPWLVVGAACLERDGLQETSQAVFETLLEHYGHTAPAHVKPFLRRARAIAILKQADSETSVLADPQLKYWVPASEEDASLSKAGAVREIWLVHEDHILHLAGPYNDYLFFRYPLQGEFEFQVEAQTGGKEPTAGNLAFGGLAYGFGPNGDEFRVWGLELAGRMARPLPFVRKESWPTYQRLTLRSSRSAVQVLVNGHPVWTDPLKTSNSPWVGLRSFGDHIPAFRNVRLTGQPVIPREVRMSDGNLLRGWSAKFYSNVVSPDVPLSEDARRVATVAGSSPPPDFDWYLRDGVIYGARRAALLRPDQPSRLTYFRPLQEGESIQYEFLYEPGKYEVHPALGRLAFLLEPSGVQVRWLTSGEGEWTGLAEDHATIEPLNRRGPRPLPLKSGEWNRVNLALVGKTMTLTLNGVEIYARPMEASNSLRFSLYHDQLRAAARVREVVMRGDWPERLSEEALKDILARAL